MKLLSIFLLLFNNFIINAIDVKAIFNRIIVPYTDEVEKNCLMQPSFIALDKDKISRALQLVIKVKRSVTSVQSIALLSAASSLYKDLQQQNITPENKTCIDQFYSIFLLHSSAIFTKNLVQQLLQVLDEISLRLVYWREQKNHPSYYFFHKSPMAWLRGKKQIDQISENIIALEKMEYDISTTLGKLVTHIRDFQKYFNENTSRAWIIHLLIIGSLVEEKITKGITLTEDEVIEKQLKYALSTVDHLQEALLEKVNFTQKPHHFVRHWMAYSALAVGALLAGTSFSTTIMDVMGTVGNAAHSFAVQPIKDITDIITRDPEAIAKREQEHKNREAEIKKISDLATSLKKQQGEIDALKGKMDINLVESMRDLKIKLMEADKDAVKDWLYDLYTQPVWFTKYISEEDYNQIIYDIDRNEFGSLLDFLRKMSIYKSAPVESMQKTAEAVLYRQAFTKLPKIYDIIIGYAKKINEGIMPIATTGVEAASDVVGMTAEQAHTIASKLGTINTWYNSTYVPRKIAALLPVGGAVWALGSAYRKYTAVSCKDLIATLAKMRSLIVEYQEHFDDYALGRMIYLLYVAKKQAILCVPTVDNHRDSVLHDLNTIELFETSLETRKDIIKNMFIVYPFLKSSD